MTIESVRAMFVDEDGVVSFSQLTRLSGLSEAEVRELVECGALEPVGATAPDWQFSVRCVVTARAACRLREDLAREDSHSLAIVFRLRQRIEELERELASLRGIGER